MINDQPDGAPNLFRAVVESDLAIRNILADPLRYHLDHPAVKHILAENTRCIQNPPKRESGNFDCDALIDRLQMWKGDSVDMLKSCAIDLVREYQGYSSRESGWQPIRTAPKDGRKINAYGASKDAGFGHDVRAGTCYWHEGRWLGGPFNSHCEPQWWQPFPALPDDRRKS